MLENISRVEFWRSVSQFKKKTKESLCLVFRFSTKREIKEFHVVVVQWRQRNVQKYLMHVQSCCFAYLYKGPSTRILFCLETDIYFLRFSLPSTLTNAVKTVNETHLFNNALQSGDFRKPTRLFFYVWTDENCFEFGIRWCHTPFTSSITHAQ